ncbi:MAG TPA: hypothetical protein VKV18_03040 [Chthonomonas sp.]|uniref:hypothetical protein n=1 Tax=Chthonomonas sp. TaxID=2282153 RepID=UPI002B4AF2E4|nr:hypothetical protein [Chthonomonas sp.]HLI47656.1 hypothetical protein [Chthonomonas sp.]
MSAERIARMADSEQPNSSAALFVHRFKNGLYELQLSPGIFRRIEGLLEEFAQSHPNLRGSYLSHEVDPSYFSDGAYGWEAVHRPRLQGLAIEGETLFEFLAFASGFRMHATPLESIVNIEELWMEPAPDKPFILRVCIYHSFPAATLLYAPTGETQEAAAAFVSRLKYLRGF